MQNEFYPQISQKYFPSYLFVVPYRNRPSSLKLFKEKVPAFIKDNIQYRSWIIIVEQDGTLPFNYGALANAGYTFFRKNLKIQKHPKDVMWIHPVDSYPIEANYSIFTDTVIFMCEGHIIGINTDLFEAINGIPNNVFGYGHEDHEIMARTTLYGIPYRSRKGTFESEAEPPIGDDKPDKRFSEIERSKFLSRVFRNDLSDGLKNHAFSMKNETLLAPYYYHIKVNIDKHQYPN